MLVIVIILSVVLVARLGNLVVLQWFVKDRMGNMERLYKLLSQLFALVSFCSKKTFTVLKLFTLIKILKLQHVSVLMDYPQGVRRT